MQKRKVHFVVETGSISGGVRVIGEVANRLDSLGWDVSIWSLNKKETLTSWFRLNDRIKWICFQRSGTIADYDQLVYVLSKQDGVKVATYWRTAHPVMEASKPGEGYYLIQDIETSYMSTPLMKGIVMETYELGLHHFTTSRWVEKQIDADYMGIGVESDVYKRIGVRREKLIVLGIARQLSLKGWDVLCETNRRLSLKGIGMTMFGTQEKMRVFVPPAEYITGLSDSGVVDLYNKASVFVSTSRHEGFNLTALEAMACGAPVVKTRDDGSDEYMDEGSNCLVGKDAEGLCDRVIDILGNAELGRTLSANGQLTAKAYQWSTAISRLEGIFAT
jgi:glycosyltransferase involved in cell wall biosynthesis